MTSSTESFACYTALSVMLLPRGRAVQHLHSDASHNVPRETALLGMGEVGAGIELGVRYCQQNSADNRESGDAGGCIRSRSGSPRLRRRNRPPCITAASTKREPLDS